MQHKVKVTVIDKKLYPELQAQYCADPEAGMCPCYNVGDEFIFERYGTADDFWHMGLNSLRQTQKNAAAVAGGSAFPHCSEAWDAIARYIYAGLQGGSIMRGWMNDERVMIACCSDGTRPVIFKIERLDYKALYFERPGDKAGCEDLEEALLRLPEVQAVEFKEHFAEVFLAEPLADEALKAAVENCGDYIVGKIE